MNLFVSVTSRIFFISATLYVMASRLLIQTSKRCVEYRVNNSRWNDTVLSVIPSVVFSECFIQCTLQHNCSAINFWSGTGTCELLPGIGVCEETTAEEGCTFIHLGDCCGRMPWEVERRNWTSDYPCITWKPHDATKRAKCFRGVLKGPEWWFCTALTPHKGLYLPSWYQSRGSFRMVTELGAPQTCLGARAGYLLLVAPECPTEWQNYTVTDPVPPQAVPVSSWKDGTPLYFISSHSRGRWYSGYYLPSTQRSFIMIKKARSPRSLRILVYV